MAEGLPVRGPNTSGSTLMQRLGWFALGLAIGMVILGMIFQGRAVRARQKEQQLMQLQLQQQEQQQQSQQAAPPAVGGTGTTPP